MCIYDVYAPCACPHGRCYTLLAQCFTISSFVTSLLAITSCFFVYVRPIPEEGEPEYPREGFGYVSRQVGVLEPPNYRQCVWYTGDEKDEYFDGMWRTGKAFSMLATIVGCGVMCVVMCTCCVAYQLRTFDALFWVCIFCFVAQILTFLSWGSDLCDQYECTWSSGTGMNITAAMLWIWAANMIKSFPEALPPLGRGDNRAPQYDDDDMSGESPYYHDDDRYYDDDDDDRYRDQSFRSRDDDRYRDPSFRSRGTSRGAPPPNDRRDRDASTYDNETYDDGTYDHGTYDDGTYDQGTYDEGTYDDGTYDRSRGDTYNSNSKNDEPSYYTNDYTNDQTADDSRSPNLVSTKSLDNNDFAPYKDSLKRPKNNNDDDNYDYLGNDSYNSGYGDDSYNQSNRID